MKTQTEFPTGDDKSTSQPNNIEAVIGVFATQGKLETARQSLNDEGVETRRIAYGEDSHYPETPNVVYDETEKVTANDVVDGVVKGAAVGAASGLLLVAIPGIGIAGPIAGALGGGFIGGIAGIDESDRGAEQPNREDYRKLLAGGKSLLIIAGNEIERQKYALKLQELGAESVNQHPPADSVVHKPKIPIEDTK